MKPASKEFKKCWATSGDSMARPWDGDIQTVRNDGQPNHSMEPTRPAAANRVRTTIEELAGRLISRPLGVALPDP